MVTSPASAVRLLALTALLVLAAFAAPASTESADFREHLVVITESGPTPRLLEVSPGDRIVWINRTETSMTAIRFDREMPIDEGGCESERAFRHLSGLPLFTSLLAPGSVAVTCASIRPGSERYELSGDHAGEGWLVVVGVPP